MSSGACGVICSSVGLRDCRYSRLEGVPAIPGDCKVQNGDAPSDFLQAIADHRPVSGLTHTFYRYPARFSPRFPRVAIETFTEPGELVMDPFMGGGTTIVEARAIGRRAIGCDISSLSVFITKAKTVLLSETDLAAVRDWARSTRDRLGMRRRSVRPKEWMAKGYQRNIDGKKTWAIRKSIEMALRTLDELAEARQRRFARCALLRLGQWALDCRSKIPSAQQFRDGLCPTVDEMAGAARDFRSSVAASKEKLGGGTSGRPVLLNCSARELPARLSLRKYRQKVRLVVTSPPYPGVYVLYHRWKVRGRKETPAPFWVADCLDGHGHDHYLLGKYKEERQETYFENIRATFSALRPFLMADALIVQMISFSDASWQLDEYLGSMTAAGYREVRPAALGIPSEQRLERSVPGRRWFASIQGDLDTSSEFVLLHTPRR